MAPISSRKFLTLFKVLSVLCLILDKADSFIKRKNWTYELKSIKSKSSDLEKLNINFEVTRVSRGVYAISGTIMINVDLVEGDINMVGGKSYRSAQGDNDYKTLPFQVGEIPLFKVINTFYKDLLMDTLKDCSDWWVFEDKIKLPVKKNTYTLDSCQFSQDGLPNHLRDGFYKVLIYGVGEVEWEIEVISEVFSNN